VWLSKMPGSSTAFLSLTMAGLFCRLHVSQQQGGLRKRGMIPFYRVKATERNKADRWHILFVGQSTSRGY
jgi:hypothetical protein